MQADAHSGRYVAVCASSGLHPGMTLRARDLADGGGSSRSSRSEPGRPPEIRVPLATQTMRPSHASSATAHFRPASPTSASAWSCLESPAPRVPDNAARPLACTRTATTRPHAATAACQPSARPIEQAPSCRGSPGGRRCDERLPAHSRHATTSMAGRSSVDLVRPRTSGNRAHRRASRGGSAMSHRSSALIATDVHARLADRRSPIPVGDSPLSSLDIGPSGQPYAQWAPYGSTLRRLEGAAVWQTATRMAAPREEHDEAREVLELQRMITSAPPTPRKLQHVHHAPGQLRLC